MSVPIEHIGLDSFSGDNVHVVLLGDSTLDNGRYLNMSVGELSVEKQLRKCCMERNWDMTVLAQDGSLLKDVRQRQMPLIPECATHVVLSASGNDLLSLLNEMVVANFSLSSMYTTVGTGLGKVAERYGEILQDLKKKGVHIAVCTLYRPNFNHMFFKSLATFALGLHNSRLSQLSVELDCSVIDFANMFDSKADFANPLELSTRGGAKLVRNIDAFVADHPALIRQSTAARIHMEEDSFLFASQWGMPLTCCATRSQQRRVYADKTVSQSLETPDRNFASGLLGAALPFSQQQERWRGQGLEQVETVHTVSA